MLGRRRDTRWPRDWSSDVCSSDLRCGATSVVSDAPSGTAGRAWAGSGGGGPSRSDRARTRSEERRVGKECTERRRVSLGQKRRVGLRDRVTYSKQGRMEVEGTGRE